MAENIQQSHQTNTEQHPQEQPNNPLTLLLTVLEYEDPHSPVPDPSVYDQQGYNCFGYDKEGYDRDGYNWQGFDRQRRSRWLRRPSTARLMLRRAFLQHSRQNCCVGSEDAKTESMAGTEDEAVVTEEQAQQTEQGEQTVEGEGEEDGRAGLRLPLARVKRIMKADPAVQIASQDAVFIIAKATVMVKSKPTSLWQFID
ncbi:DNA polymerase epsilon subunit 4 [Portunus trituberculatus]|uniref:DNA polymerase epsilon subunit 4 n=1 Tax=Portunus trituberculatus TaxID=210409 RepID=A0A5B7CJ57_PORTR|nr:DNA polymerase epsilon subunit 4 [Portunus trituberculatus]